jgi:hypothetical protein
MGKGANGEMARTRELSLISFFRPFSVSPLTRFPSYPFPLTEFNAILGSFLMQHAQRASVL